MDERATPQSAGAMDDRYVLMFRNAWLADITPNPRRRPLSDVEVLAHRMASLGLSQTDVDNYNRLGLLEAEEMSQ